MSQIPGDKYTSRLILSYILCVWVQRTEKAGRAENRDERQNKQVHSHFEAAASSDTENSGQNTNTHASLRKKTLVSQKTDDYSTKRKTRRLRRRSVYARWTSLRRKRHLLIRKRATKASMHMLRTVPTLRNLQHSKP